MQAFRFWLQDQLHDKGWAGSELARRMKVAPATVNFWLAGTNLPSRGMIPRLAKALGANEQEIWDMVLERTSPQYGDIVSRALNLPPDLTVEEARYLHLAFQAFRKWATEMERATVRPQVRPSRAETH